MSQALRRLRAFVEERDYAGYDPYDALNSPAAPWLTARLKWGRIALTQAVRRSPVNLRPLLGIRPAHNAKALALFLEGYSRLLRQRPGNEFKERISRLVELLAGLRVPGAAGHGWGYNFPWQSQAFFAPRGTPNIVVTAFAGHALLDAYEAAGDVRALELAMPARDFLLSDLNRIGNEDSFCFSYTPLDHYPVLNASVLGASLLIRIAHRTSDGEARRAALAALDFAMRRQNADGSFPYSIRPGFKWVDSFHTGFVLEGVRRFLDLGEGAGFKRAYDAGVAYYAGNFFLLDGAPKYYSHQLFPIDIHSSAEGVAFFALEGERWRKLARLALDWMLEYMQDPTGYFYFRKGRLLTNRIPYMRWAQAWAFRALACAASVEPL